MIAQPASKISTKLRSKDGTNRAASLLSRITQLWADNGASSKASTGAAQSFQLGDPVCHGQFGSGSVVAHWPDGTLLVRFDGVAKSRLISPSLLNRENGGWTQNS